jgi:prepilin signal peptidase PulO-like enzyme (type II secretory pathway)
MDSWFFFLLLTIFGWLSGILVNYISETIPYTRSFRHPVCEECGESQGWYEFLVWPRRCHYCGAQRRFSTILVENFYVILSIFIWFESNSVWQYALAMVVIIYIGAVTLIDIKHKLVLHEMSVFGMVIAAYAGYSTFGIKLSIIGGAAGFGIMLFFYFASRGVGRLLESWQDVISNEPALGFGDVTFTGILGLMLGWPGIMFALFVSVYAGFFLGIIYLLALARHGKEKKKGQLILPFVPFLAFGSAIAFMLMKPI